MSRRSDQRRPLVRWWRLVPAGCMDNRRSQMSRQKNTLQVLMQKTAPAWSPVGCPFMLQLSQPDLWLLGATTVT